MIAWPTCSVPFDIPLHEFVHGNSRVQIQFKEATKGFLRAVKRVIAGTTIRLKDLLPPVDVAKISHVLHANFVQDTNTSHGT